VTGATGFVGRRLVPGLIEAGYAVHALVRETSDRSSLAGLPVTYHTGSLEEADSLVRAARAAARAGTPALAIHSGAMISYRGTDRARQERINVGGTQDLLRAVGDSGFDRVVHVGSIVAVGAARETGATLDEDSPWDPFLEHVDYVRTKRRADELALESGAIVVDPGAIFGPGAEHSNTTRFVDEIRRRGAPPWVPPGGLAVVDVDDVAGGILAAAERGRAGRRYLLTESNWSLLELFTLGAELVGRRAPRGVLPRWAWLAIATAVVPLDRVRPLELLAPQGLRLLAETYRTDSTRAQAELGWRPRPFRSTLERTLAWLDGS
jgi:dihydroflavonol-4-reductase